MTYKEKLLDPRWQRRRLEVLNRDNFTCQDCFSKSKTLHVHHLDYAANVDPWDYPDHYYLTLCADCHSKISEIRKDYENVIIKSLRLSLYDSFIWKCTTDVIAQYTDVHRLFFLLWDLEEKAVMNILEAAFEEKKKTASSTYILNSSESKTCRACGGEFKFFEKYNYHQCATCGFTLPNGTNKNS